MLLFATLHNYSTCQRVEPEDFNGTSSFVFGLNSIEAKFQTNNWEPDFKGSQSFAMAMAENQ